MNKDKILSVSAIKDGTVIDHILAGQGLKIIRLLKTGEHPVTVGLNLKSRSMGLKDLIKIHDLFLDEAQASQIAVFAPLATVNVIQQYKIIRKFRVSMPSSISGALLCPNSRCVTHLESVVSRFSVEERNGRVLLECSFCEKLFSREELHD